MMETTGDGTGTGRLRRFPNLLTALGISLQHCLVILFLTVAIAASVNGAYAEPADPGIGLTQGEADWLREHRNLVIAPSPDFPPIEFFDRNGLYSGIAADYVGILERKLGITFKVVRLSSWQEIMQSTARGEVDIWGAATETPARSSMMLFTRPYLSFPAVIVVRKGAFHDLTLDKLQGLKVVSLARHVTDDYLNEYYPDLNKILVPDVPTGLKMVSFGVADAIVVNEATASYYYHTSELGLTNLAIAGQSDKAWPLSFASRRDWPELNSILQKALDSITVEEHDSVVRRWVNLEREGYISHRAFLIVLACIGAALLAIAFVLVLNRSLRRIVRQRTVELQNELSERHRIEAELVESKERLSRFFSAAFEGLCFHEGGRIVDVNPASMDILGYRPEDVIGRNITEFIAPESRLRVVEQMKDNEAGPYEVVGLRNDGTPIPLEVRARSVDTGKTLIRVVGFRDISERKRRENDLRRYQEELEAKTESLEAIRSIADKLHRSLDLNTVAEQAVKSMMLRSNSPSVAMFLLDEAGSHLDMIFSVGFSEELLDRSKRLPVRGSLSGLAVESRRVVMSRDVAEDDRVEPSVGQGLHDHGYCGAVSVPLLAEERVLGVLNLLYHDTRIPTSAQKSELLVIGQTVGLAISHAVNIAHLREEMAVRQRAESDLQRLNAELEQRVARRTAELEVAKVRAEEADRLKSAFLATMSHELRTPLNSIIGFTGILLMGLVGPLSEEQQKQLNMVQDSARHLLELINDVLDISKIEAGRVELARDRFDMQAAIRKSLEKITPQADKKGLRVTSAISAAVGLIVGDRRRIEQVLINLLTNAVKFTEQGEVRIESEVEDRWLVTRVIDTGIGIRPEDMETLFKPFRQVDSGITRQYEGTGLGLSICERLAEAMGGGIRVESEWGRGSCFIFTLPLERSPL